LKENFNKLIQDIKKIKTTEEASSYLLKRIDTPKIRKALEFGKKAHEGQKRKSGEDYIIHPILVAVITSFFEKDENVITAAILHDVVEDTPYDIDYIKENFSEEVANLVEGLTKIVNIRENSLIPSNSNEKLTKSALTFRKLLLISIKDIRVLLIKLCDRLHNMLTLDALPPHKQKRIAEETMVVYAPIAHRLGIGKLKNLLEDLSFKYLLPEEYAKIDDYIKSHEKEFFLKLNSFIQKIEKLMIKNGFEENDFEIQSRIKHHYSIYLKMQRKGISIEEVLDLLAIRIIVKKPVDCYKALGIVHLNFRPLISRFKDYIAIPKENGYQSIHTTVYSESSIVEVQIRTFDMDKNAEYGIAAHWKYKLDTAIPNTKWLEEIKDYENTEDFYDFMKDSLFSEDIYVYTPKLDVVTLPVGATVLDFAYAIHSDIGNKALYAFVNKEKTSLLHQLKKGDMVKIITAQEPIPRCSWINSLKTSKAKYEQKKLCRQKEKEINRNLAISILCTIFDLDKFKIKALLKANKLCEQVPKIVDDENFLKDVVNKIYKTIKRRKLLYFKNIKLKEYFFGNIKVITNKHISDVRFNYCCHPKSGDKILGLLDGREVEIHHRFCNNAENKIKKCVFVDWTNDTRNRYFLVVSLPNKKGELAKFVGFLTKMNVFIHSINLGKESSHCKLEIEFDEKNYEKIKNLIKKQYNIIEFIPLKDAYNG
jgi:RelA/SpoT family (p)ppGpp synthetase